ncbi:MAG: hypothetical protein HKN92_08135 [Chitinophagales bacterium]|nr:hypothetical protein [Chitinophagales bacterium]
MIHTSDFYFPHSRWYLIINEWLPYILIKLNTPITWIAIGYSVNYMLTAYIFTMLSVKFSKSLVPGWIALFMLLGISWSLIYYPVNYFYLYLILFYFPLRYAILNDQKTSIVVFAVVSLFIVLGAHKVYMVALVFMYALLLVEFKDRFIKYAFWIFPTLIGLSLIKVLFLTESTYDDQILSGIASTSKWKLWNSKFFVFFLKKFVLTPGSILLLWVLFYTLFRTGYNKLIPVTSLLASFCFFILSSVHLYNGASHTYMELYANFSIAFLAIPVLYIGFELPAFKKHMPAFLIIIVLFGFFRSLGYQNIKKRVVAMEEMFEAAEREDWGDKILIAADNPIRNRLMIDWALPYESMLLSTINGNCKTAYVDEFKPEVDWNNRKLFISTFEIIPNHNYYLNEQYFELEERVYYRYE